MPIPLTTIIPILTPTLTFEPAPRPTLGPPTSTPHPLTPYTIEGLRSRLYPGGTINIRSVLTTTETFSRYYIDYPSDNLSITGIMQIPPGDGPFPAVILNHGYIPFEEYWSGSDTANAASYLNAQGFLTIAPDFRNWGESDTGNSFFSTGQVIDALNLVSALDSLPQADTGRIGMWGHSMGGGITLKAIIADPRIKAAVLYASVSARDAEVLARWGPGCSPAQPFVLDEKCGGAEILADDINRPLFLAYANAINNPEVLYRVSAINYLHYVDTPVQIHIGLEDRRTPPEWSAAIRQGLQRADKPVEYFSYPSQGHAFKDRGWLTFMERTTDFFYVHLVNQPKTR